MAWPLMLPFTFFYFPSAYFFVFLFAIICTHLSKLMGRYLERLTRCMLLKSPVYFPCTVSCTRLMAGFAVIPYAVVYNFELRSALPGLRRTSLPVRMSSMDVGCIFCCTHLPLLVSRMAGLYCQQKCGILLSFFERMLSACVSYCQILCVFGGYILYILIYSEAFTRAF